MAVELSSNWKKLQAQIKSEPSFKPAAKKPTAKPVAKKRAREIAEGGDGDKNHSPAAKRPNRASESAYDRRRAETSRNRAAAAMGVTQSSQPIKDEGAIRRGGRTGGGRALSSTSTAAMPPSLALWAEDHDISPEDLAQAYGLGVPKGGSSSRGGALAPGSGLSSSTALAAAARDDCENTGLTAGLAVGKYVALDCEMVGVGADGHDDALARVSVVDFFGRQVYDSYVQMQRGQRVADWRTAVSGITPRHLRQARPFAEVRDVVAGLLRGDDANGSKGGNGGKPRILVGHDVKHDLRVLDLSHPPRLIRDTAKFSGFKQYGNGPKPALRVLARTLLDVEIQQGAHSSVEDARVTMQLFRLHKSAFDVECANRFGEDPGVGPDVAAPEKKKLQKKKRKKH